MTELCSELEVGDRVPSGGSRIVGPDSRGGDILRVVVPEAEVSVSLCCDGTSVSLSSMLLIVVVVVEASSPSISSGEVCFCQIGLAVADI